MGETWIQQQNRAKKQENSLTGMSEAPFEGTIQSVSSETDTMKITGPFGTRSFNVLHPYQGNSSWVRSMPDGAQTVLIQFRSDTKVAEIMSYKAPSSAERLKRYKAPDDTEQGVIGALGAAAASALSGALGLSTDDPPEPSANKFEAYRPIVSGEHDVGSLGMAQTFWGNRGVLDSRAGIVKQGLNHDRLENFVKSAVHRKLFHHHESNKILDEERIGVVWRPDNESYIKRKWCKYKGKFAKERSFQLLDGEKKPLLWEREGHVFDDVGELETSDDTGKPLRVKNIYYTVGGKLAAALGQREEFTYQLDEEGNLIIDQPDGATTGFIFRTPKGTHQIEIGVDYNITVEKNWIETINGDKTVNIAGTETTITSDSADKTYEKDVKVTIAEKFDGDINGAKIFCDGTSIHVEDTNGNMFDLDSKGIAVIDTNGNTVDLTANGIAAADLNGNKVEMTASGIVAEDLTGNKIETTASAVKVTAVAELDLDGSTGKLKLANGMVGLGGPGAELLDLLDQELDAFINAPYLVMTGVGPSSPLMPPAMTQLVTIKSLLASIKGGI